MASSDGGARDSAADFGEVSEQLDVLAQSLNSALGQLNDSALRQELPRRLEPDLEAAAQSIRRLSEQTLPQMRERTSSLLQLEKKLDGLLDILAQPLARHVEKITGHLTRQLHTEGEKSKRFGIKMMWGGAICGAVLGCILSLLSDDAIRKPFRNFVVGLFHSREEPAPCKEPSMQSSAQITSKAQAILNSMKGTALDQPAQGVHLQQRVDEFAACVQSMKTECLATLRDSLEKSEGPEVDELLPRVIWAQYVQSQSDLDSVARVIHKDAGKLKATTAYPDMLFADLLIRMNADDWSDTRNLVQSLGQSELRPVLPPIELLRRKTIPMAATYRAMAPKLDEYLLWQSCPVSVMVSTRARVSDEETKLLTRKIRDIHPSVILAGDGFAAPANLLSTQVFATPDCDNVLKVIAERLTKELGLRVSPESWTSRGDSIIANDRRHIGSNAKVIVRFGDEVRAQVLGR